jgi:hypothetical protein
LASRLNQPNAFAAASNSGFGVGVRATWSRAISDPTKSKGGWGPRVPARADSKLAPCMARPNLFSGD